MTIYNRWGDPITIIANCGPQQPSGFKTFATLVEVAYGDCALSSYKFAEFLKADGGINEIEAAVQAAPVKNLPELSLLAAIKRAL